MKVTSLAVSVKGPGHIANGLPNQDACFVGKVNSGYLAVVCDGMGSRSKADIGAKQACRSVRAVVASSAFERDNRELIRDVYQHWLDNLKTIDPTQAVTTCLFVWLGHNGRLRTFQLGDGVIMTVPYGVVTKAAESQSFGNQTTGLGFAKKFSDWQVTSQTLKPGEAVILMSDGISDDLLPSMELDFANTIIQRCHRYGLRRRKSWLKNELVDWATPHHLDDKTLALLTLNG